MYSEVAAALYSHIELLYIDILGALAINHRIVISMRTLKRSLSRQNLFRRRQCTDIVELVVFIHEQIRGSGNQQLPLEGSQLPTGWDGCITKGSLNTGVKF